MSITKEARLPNRFKSNMSLPSPSEYPRINFKSQAGHSWCGAGQSPSNDGTATRGGKPYSKQHSSRQLDITKHTLGVRQAGGGGGATGKAAVVPPFCGEQLRRGHFSIWLGEAHPRCGVSRRWRGTRPRSTEDLFLLDSSSREGVLASGKEKRTLSVGQAGDGGGAAGNLQPHLARVLAGDGVVQLHGLHPLPRHLIKGGWN